jgi:hypothetical protein
LRRRNGPVVEFGVEPEAEGETQGRLFTQPFEQFERDNRTISRGRLSQIEIAQNRTSQIGEERTYCISLGRKSDYLVKIIEAVKFRDGIESHNKAADNRTAD